MVETIGFDEDEQWTKDLSWFAVDIAGKIGHFTTGGEKLLPPKVAKNKQLWEKINEYFNSLSSLEEENYLVCSDLSHHRKDCPITDLYGYIKPSAKMTEKGLYSYDSPPLLWERPYIRVTIPKKELTLEDLPEEIKHFMEGLRLYEISFAETSLIPEVLVNNL
jgi:hypothetical protein